MNNMKVSQNSEINALPLGFIKQEPASHVKRTLPILFIHGAESSKETWAGPIGALKETHTIYAIDLRGHGETPVGPEKEYNLQNLVEDVHEFVKQEHLTRFILVAHSMGTRVATTFAANYPHHVAGYLIEDMEMIPREKETIADDEFRALTEFNQWQPTMALAIEELARYGYSKAKIESWIRQKRIVPAGEGFHIGINPLVTHLVKNAISASPEPMQKMKNLSESGIPVMLLKAEADSSVSEEGLHQMLEACPDLKVHVIPNATHSIHKADFPAFLAHLKGFVSEIEMLGR